MDNQLAISFQLRSHEIYSIHLFFRPHVNNECDTNNYNNNIIIGACMPIQGCLHTCVYNYHLKTYIQINMSIITSVTVGINTHAHIQDDCMYTLKP